MHGSAQCAHGSAHGKMSTLDMGSLTRVYTFFEGHRSECTPFLRAIGQSAHLFSGSSTTVHTFFKEHRSVCTHFLGLFMSVHIFFMPVIQIVSRVHTFSDFSAAQLPQNSGSGFRAPGPGGCAGRGGGKRFIPSECQGCCAPAGPPPPFPPPPPPPPPPP